MEGALLVEGQDMRRSEVGVCLANAGASREAAVAGPLASDKHQGPEHVVFCGLPFGVPPHTGGKPRSGRLRFIF